MTKDYNAINISNLHEMEHQRIPMRKLSNNIKALNVDTHEAYVNYKNITIYMIIFCYIYTLQYLINFCTVKFYRMLNAERKKNEELTKKLKEITANYKKEESKVSKLRSERKAIIKHTRQETMQQITNALSTVFTPNQIKMLLSPGKRKTRWSIDDIAAAISLRSISPKAYRYLKYSMKIPLPAMSTIRRWVANIDLSPGILSNVLKIMKYKSISMSDMEKLTVLSFDEIHLSNIIEIDRKKQKTVGPHSYCEVVMARGLFQKWKQPIFYDYDTAITEEILCDIITQLYANGYTVVAVTCNLGPRNKQVWKSLNVDLNEPEKCSFPHPCDNNLKIFTFFDVPHMLKLLRNHFLDDGCLIDGKTIDKTILEQILLNNSPEINTCHKLQQYHLDVQGSERQKVRPAAQTFSNSVAKNIEYWGQKGRLDSFNWRKSAAMIKTFNDWFDIFNNISDFTNAYGKNLLTQNAVLLEMTKYMKDLRFGNHKSMIECQKGIIRCNESLENLLNYLKCQYSTHNISYIF